MITTAFDLEKNQANRGLVCEEFRCSIYDIVCYANTFFKKVVVFFLVTEHGFNKRNIGLKYQITYLYVPTVVVSRDRISN
jgi:hypothetical protein